MKRSIARRVALLFFGALLLTGVSGCLSPETGRSLATFPSLRDLQTETALATKEALVDAIPPPPFYGRMEMQILYLPLEAEVEAAWYWADEAAIPEVARTVWQGNGLRVGLLSRARLENFLTSLPPTFGAHRRSAAITDEPVSLLETGPLRQTVVIDTTMPPFVAEEVSVSRGTLRLLLEPVLSSGQLAARLTPENHRPGYTAMLQTVHPDRTGHRRFSELGLLLHPQGQNMIVLGLRWPEEKDGAPATTSPQSPDPNTDAKTADQSAAEPALPPASADNRPFRDFSTQPLSRNLGNTLLVSRVRGRPAQAIVIFRLQRVS